MKSENGKVYWVTGLSGAGKTTIGTILYNVIHAKKSNVFRLDGDIGRWAFNDMIGYGKTDREAGAYRNSRVCKMIADQGIDVVCCTVSMFDGVRTWNRDNIPLYREIFLDVPMDVLIARDQKGLYSKVSRGEAKDVVGMDLQLEYPKNPDIRVVNDGSATPEKVVANILDSLRKQFGDSL